MTGEFFGTFLIPSIVHQDPHYHRMPDATIKRRIAHAIYQVVWTQGDNGNGMPNYADLVGFAIDDEIGNLYVPGQQTEPSASADRYAIGLATAPIDNFITEFLPDVARHIHIHDRPHPAHHQPGGQNRRRRQHNGPPVSRRRK